MSKSGYDAPLVPNDGGKYSPSLRKLRQYYFHDRTSTNDIIPSSLKCNDCHKHDGLFQCCHCNQRLCIRCCNKHYKKMTNELEYLNELTDRLLAKIFFIKTDLEKEKKLTIEQCQQWRIESINRINQAHALVIQTIQDEYEILSKDYEGFVEKEMAQINVELVKIRKGNLGSLISSPTTMRKDWRTSLDLIKERIETFAQQIEDRKKCSFEVNLPTYDIDENLRVESSFGEKRRSTSVISNDEDTESKTSSPDLEPSSDLYDSTYGTGLSSSTSSLPDSLEDFVPISRRHTYAFHRAILPNESIEKNQENDRLRYRRRTTALPIRSRSSVMTDRLSHEYPWLYYRTKSISSPFIQ